MTEKREAMYERIKRHGAALLAIFPRATERDPVKLCKRLRRIEAQGAAFALRCCNGPEWPSEDAQQAEGDAILRRARNLLQPTGGVAHAMFLNRDPRGYSLKIDAEWMRANGWHIDRSNRHTNGSGSIAVAQLHKDWGGYGIIAPDLRREGD